MKYCIYGNKIVIANLALELMGYGGEPVAVFRNKFLMPVYLTYDDDNQDYWMEDYVQNFKDMFLWKQNHFKISVRAFSAQFEDDWCNPERSDALRTLQSNIQTCEEEVEALD